MIRISLSAVRGCLAAMLLALCPALAHAADNVFPAGQFADASLWRDINDDSLKVVARGPNGMKALRFESKTDRAGAATATLDVDPAWKTVRVTAWFNVTRLKTGAESWQNVRVSMRALGADGKAVGYGPTPQVGKPTGGWQRISATGAVPEGTIRFEVQPGIFAPEGEGMIADIQVVPNPPLPHVVWTEAFPEGQFDAAVVDAWTLGQAKVITEGTQRLLRLHNDDPQKTTSSTLRLKVDPAWTSVTIRFKARGTDVKPGAEGWHEARLQWTFENANGERVGPWPSVAGLKASSADWKELESSNAVPADAAYLRIEPSMFQATGTFDVTDIRVVPQVKGKPPVGMKLHWGEEPIEVTSPTRSTIVLNGLWRFQPATGPRASGADDDWGFVQVPGSWRPVNRFPGVVSQGSWGRSIDLSTLDRAWYQRPILVPDAWKGRSVHLTLRRISTDAAVLLDGVEVGRVSWPSGTVDVTSAVKFGQEQTLTLKVIATPEEGDVLVLMGTADAQVSRRAATLQTRGVIDDVLLTSQPKSALISDVFVQTSVREKSLTLDVDIQGIARAGTVVFEADVVDASGAVARTFRAEKPVIAASSPQTVQVRWDWPDAKLWDIESPHLYTLRLKAVGAGLDDAISQRFGFREFWIEERKFFLNGTEIRLRPNMLEEMWGWPAPTRDGVAAMIDGHLAAGFNFGEMWPWDEDERGTYHSRRLFAEVADEKGLLLSGNALHSARYLRSRSWTYIWEDAGVKSRYGERMGRSLREYRNHPSIVMWGSTANYFGNEQDSSPQRLDRIDYLRGRQGWDQNVRAGREVVGLIKKLDPTRPVFFHHGSYVGDVHTNNMYLNLLPLQDRTEWLSAWAERGEQPFMAVEFGTPLHTTFMRGRDGFTNTVQSEPWVTEFSAIYLGRRAYELERDEYRAEIAQKWQKDQKYANWQNNAPIENAPAFQEIQRLFTTRTWRAWRTWGLTGGLIPWNKGHGWQVRPPELPRVTLPPFKPGQRGPVIDSVESKWMNYLRSPDWPLLPGGEALLANNGSTLAWIAGPADAFTDRTHLYRSSATVRKQAVVINDQRAAVDWSIEWTARSNGQAIASGRTSGSVNAASDVRTPIEFALPRVDAKRDVTIELKARVGSREHSDAFALRVFPETAPIDIEVAVHDPKGLTTAMLRRIGARVREWNGSPAPLVVIGREADALPATLEQYIKDGGRVLMMCPARDVLRDRMALRIADPISRHVYAVDRAHPVMRGLDDRDLQNWASSSTLIAPIFPDYNANLLAAEGERTPRYGWRWGARHGVSSAMIEKPHRSGVRPILEGEFDLQYTPLLELDYGRGRLTLCTLDLEDHVRHDPAAELLLQNLLQHASTAPLNPRVAVAYVGGDVGAKLLDDVGVDYTRIDSIPARPEDKLLVVDPRGQTDDTALRTFVAAGGRALVLASRDASIVTLDVPRTQGTLPVGLVEVPAWPEAAGLSASDLRARVPATATLLDASSAFVGAGGLLARVEVGSGVAIVVQIDPDATNADERTYLRFTRWRQTRALAQVLSNLGASFAIDRQFFVPRPADEVPTLALAGEWRATQMKRIADPTGNAQSPHEPISDRAREFVGRDIDLSGWSRMTYPGYTESIGGDFAAANGETVVARDVDVPQRLLDRPLTLSLGAIDDFDDVFVNGIRIGGSPDDRKFESSQWNVERRYAIPPGVLKPGRNRIAIRIWDQFGEGGARGDEADVRMFDATYVAPPGFYHRDYRTDFELGDDPYRYYRW